MAPERASDAMKGAEEPARSEAAAHYAPVSDTPSSSPPTNDFGPSSGGTASEIAPKGNKPLLLRRGSSKIERLPSLALRRHQGHLHTLILSGWEPEMAGSVVNLCSTIIGTGILVLPLTGVWLGLVPMVLMQIGLAAVNAYGCRILLLIGGYTSSYSFEEVTERTLGHLAARFLDICILVRSLIVLASILIFTGDFLGSLGNAFVDALGLDVTLNKDVLLVVITALVIYPLALMRSMNSLAGFSAFKLVCILAFMAFVVFLSVQNMLTGKMQPFKLVETPSWRWLRSLPIIAFSYHSQVNLFPIYAEVRDATLRKGLDMITHAYIICSVLFILVSTFGYLQFPNSPYGNYLVNFDDLEGGVSGYLIHVLRAMFLIVTVFTFPMQLFAARIATHSLIFPHQEKMTAVQSFVITTLMTGVALAVSLATDDIALVLGIGGSIFTSYVSMILPAQAYLKVIEMRCQGDGDLLSAEDRWENQVDLERVENDEASVQVAAAFRVATCPAQKKYEKAKAWAVLVTGVVVGVAGLVATLMFN